MVFGSALHSERKNYASKRGVEKNYDDKKLQFFSPLVGVDRLSVNMKRGQGNGF
jgi:hypothetical protein